MTILDNYKDSFDTATIAANNSIGSDPIAINHFYILAAAIREGFKN